MNERMRFNPAEASAYGQQDAQVLLMHLDPANTEWTVSPAELLGNALAGIIGLAADNRLDECEARKLAFCGVVGPALADGYRLAPITPTSFQAEAERLIHSAIYVCSQVSAGRIISAHPEDEDAIAMLCDLQLAVRALEPKFTETEGGEL